MIYSIGFILLLLLLSNNNNNGVFGQQQQLWPSSIGSFSIPSLTQILSSVNTNIPQFDIMQMQNMNMPNFQMPSFRSMPSMGGSMPSMGSMASFPSPGASGSPSLSSLSSSSPPSSFSMPSFPNNNNFPSFQRPSSTLPSFPSAGGQGGNQPSPQLPSISQNNNNNQPQPQFPSLNNLPTPDPRVMQNALSSIGSSLNNIQQQIRPNSGSSSSSSNNNNNPSTSSLPPYPYTSDSVKIDAALRQLMPGYDTMTPAALQSTISSLSDKDMEAFQKEIGIDNTKFSKLSVFEAPFAPSSSCHQLDFGCQSYSSCFSCYSNRAQPKCGACLQLRSCSDGSLTCFLDGICRLCDASNNAPMCTTLQKRCANSNSGPPHP